MRHLGRMEYKRDGMTAEAAEHLHMGLKKNPINHQDWFLLGSMYVCMYVCMPLPTSICLMSEVMCIDFLYFGTVISDANTSGRGNVYMSL